MSLVTGVTRVSNIILHHPILLAFNTQGAAMPIKNVTMSQAKVVTAATKQTMELAKKLDTNGDKKLDETELQKLMTDMDTFTPSQGALPDEKTRMQMLVVQSLTKLSDSRPDLANATSVKLSDLRISMKKTVNELVTTAKKLDSGGLGGVLSLTMLPDVAVKHVQEHVRANERGDS